ncbi:unnamed protein product [Adineta ricciae]|nr:unnamed protein product [Adineta ricciae]
MPQLRKQPANQTIFLLLIILFIEILIDLPMRLYYLYENQVAIQTGGFCMFWNWIASVLNIIGLHLMAFASIERHFFIFNSQFRARHRFLLSIIPMILSVIYPLAFYTGTVFGSWWCANTYDYSVLACGAPCYLITSAFFPLFGILTHHVLPVFIVVFANVILVIRVCHQKTQMCQVNIWRKTIRMSVQLLSIAFTYIIVWLPQCVLFIMLALGSGEVSTIAGWLIYEFTGNLTSLTAVFCPFVMLAGLPKLCHKIKRDFEKVFVRQNIVVPSHLELVNTGRQMRTPRANS